MDIETARRTGHRCQDFQCLLSTSVCIPASLSLDSTIVQVHYTQVCHVAGTRKVCELRLNSIRRRSWWWDGREWNVLPSWIQRRLRCLGKVREPRMGMEWIASLLQEGRCIAFLRLHDAHLILESERNIHSANRKHPTKLPRHYIY